MPKARSHIAVPIIVICLTAVPQQLLGQPNSMDQPVCTGRYNGGLRPTIAELADILNKHAEWVKDDGPNHPQLSDDPTKADLCGANLAGANLAGALLIDARLDGTNLRKAHLTGAHLPGARLDGALLLDADLTGADLFRVDLAGAHLQNAHLERAFLGDADLTNANLTGAHLLDAELPRANLAGTYLGFDPDSAPKPLAIYYARNLQLVRFLDQPAGLVKLRHDFKDLGLRVQESQLTYAIRRSELDRKYGFDSPHTGHFVHSWLERRINFVFFD